ncbi:hypothetical protein [Ructibacterium gallinarum]|uniref:Uncharacterized protein n=1 Tax=Ructibacterium gallinarum TaxID=2779355 RepID=A0A9D5M125_9FIRM|nr:hypothetical protein [Ructibacterium gallinarum]MBE5039488.1 hypothetical protein [Ructibacterium gallinarum]
MIGVMTLFGEVDLQSVLKKVFRQNDMEFIAENCSTSVQLLERVQEQYKITDVILVAAAAVNMEIFPELVSEIRSLESKMRMILILNGNREQYPPEQFSEYENKRIDVLFDDNGFDTQELIDLVKQGKLPRQKAKSSQKQTQFKEIKQIPRFPLSVKREKVLEEPESAVEEQSKESALTPRAFSPPTGRYVIGLFNAAHGAGATTAAIRLAEYFALYGYVTKLADLTGTDALSLVDIKNVEVGIGARELSRFKQEANILIIDFGTPYDIVPRGDAFQISYGYPPEYIREINRCSLKILFGFTDIWQIGRMKFFLKNEQWKEMIDASYIFMTDGEERSLQSEYPEINIMNRENGYINEITLALKEDER